MRSIATLGCNIYSQTTVAHVTLPKAVLNSEYSQNICSVFFNQTLQPKTFQRDPIMGDDVDYSDCCHGLLAIWEHQQYVYGGHLQAG